tara:strand:- start:3311 stop:3493 length:183 start_codon:yes stop_codon:yes gene_type:complete
MKSGDLVRFKFPEMQPDEWASGLLVEYHTWEKLARILYLGKIISIHASHVQLATRAKESI